MSVVLPSEALLDIICGASDNIVIAAPYIKTNSLQRLVGAVPNTVQSVTCITRWLPEDIASGVCDAEILEIILDRPGGTLLVQPHLHAKYYRAGERCIVGSANLTARGLGWVTPANVELLVELPRNFPGLSAWEANLLASAVTVTQELRDRIVQEAARLRESGEVGLVPEMTHDRGSRVSVSQWTPSCPAPDRLWDVYVGRGTDTMVSSARQAAQNDLAALAPPAGLTRNLFEAYVAGILRQMPLLVEIDRLASGGLSDGQAQEFLSERRPNDASVPTEQAWRILKAWLTHFFPSTYRVEAGQEILVMGKRLPLR